MQEKQCGVGEERLQNSNRGWHQEQGRRYQGNRRVLHDPRRQQEHGRHAEEEKQLQAGILIAGWPTQILIKSTQGLVAWRTDSTENQT